MTLRARLILYFTLFALVLLPSIGWIAYSVASKALVRDASARLEGVRRVLGDAVEREIDSWRAQAAALADGRQTREALADFARSVETLESELQTAGVAFDESAWLRVGGEVRSNYDATLLRALTTANGAPPNSTTWMPAGRPALLLQHAFIAANPAPPGRKGEQSRIEDLLVSKDPLRVAMSRTRYATTLQRHRPGWELLASRGPLSDVALVDATGYVLATLRHTHLLAQNLRAPQHRTSAPSRAFRAAMLSAGDPARRVVIEDAAPSEWDGNEPSAWLACSVEDDLGRRIGAVLVRVAISRISALTRFKGGEDEVGLGAQGAAVIVGRDGKARSEYRFASQLPPASLRRVAAPDGSSSIQTAVLALDLSQHPAVTALSKPTDPTGNTGVVAATDFAGRATLAAYGPVRADDLGWGAIVYVTRAESLAAAVALRDTMLYTLGGIVAAGLLGSWLLARSLTGPIIQLAATARKVANGDELQRAVVVAPRSEVGQTAEAFNTMLDALNQSRERQERSHRELREDVSELAAVAGAIASGDLRVRSSVTRGEVAKIAQALNHAIETLCSIVRAARDLSNSVASDAAASATEQTATAEGATSSERAALETHDMASTALNDAAKTAVFASSIATTMQEIVSEATNATEHMQTLRAELSNIVDLSRKTTSDLKTAVENISGAEARTDLVQRLSRRIKAHALNVGLLAKRIDAHDPLNGELAGLGQDILASSTEANDLAVADSESMRVTLESMRAAMTAGEGQSESLSLHAEYAHGASLTFGQLAHLVTAAAPSLGAIADAAAKLQGDLERAAASSHSNATFAQQTAHSAGNAAERARRLAQAAQQLRDATNQFQV